MIMKQRQKKKERKEERSKSTRRDIYIYIHKIANKVHNEERSSLEQRNSLRTRASIASHLYIQNPISSFQRRPFDQTFTYTY